MTSEDLNEIRNEIEEEMKKATDFALTSPMPDHDELYKDVYVEYSNSLLGLR